MILQCKSCVLQMHVQLVWAGELILLALLVWRRKSGWMIDWRLSVGGRTHFGWGWMLEIFLYNITGVMEAHTNWPRGMLDTPGTHHRVSVCLNSYFPKWKAVGYFLICQCGFVREPYTCTGYTHLRMFHSRFKVNNLTFDVYLFSSSVLIRDP